jgi:hypothetical protein
MQVSRLWTENRLNPDNFQNDYQKQIKLSVFDCYFIKSTGFFQTLGLRRVVSNQETP